MKQVIDQLVEGSKKKLLLWRLTVEQISDLEKNREPSALVTFYSPVSGTPVDLSDMTTAWVKTGGGMYESRIIKLGIRNKKEVEVISAIEEVELVVTA